MAINRRGSDFWIDYYVLGRRRRKKVGPNYRMARLALQKIKVSIAEGKYLDVKRDERITFDEIAQDFLDYSRNNKRSYLRDTQLARNVLATFGGRRLSEITPVFIETFKGKRLGDGLRPATVNREIAFAKSAVNWAIKGDKATSNPFMKVKLLREDNEILRYLTQEEMGRLVGACRPPLRAVVITALNTGMRKGEILNLKWQDVRLAQGLIFVEHTKSGRRREIPINGPLRSLLEELLGPVAGPESPVFLNEDGMPYLRVEMAFQNALKRAGITCFRFHDLRHTAASWMVMSGVDLATVREILGHASVKTTCATRTCPPCTSGRRWRCWEPSSVPILAQEWAPGWTPSPDCPLRRRMLVFRFSR